MPKNNDISYKLDVTVQSYKQKLYRPLSKPRMNLHEEIKANTVL